MDASTGAGWVEVLALLKDITLTGALAVALWAGATRKWVWGHHYQEALGREQWWRDYATSLHDLTDQAVKLAEGKHRP